jgi:hypothetical protein
MMEVGMDRPLTNGEAPPFDGFAPWLWNFRDEA